MKIFMIIKVLEVILLKLAEYFILILKGIPGVLLLLLVLAIGLAIGIAWLWFVVIEDGIIENHFMKWVSSFIIFASGAFIWTVFWDEFEIEFPKIAATAELVALLVAVGAGMWLAAFIAFSFLESVVSLLAGLGDAIQHARNYPYH